MRSYTYGVDAHMYILILCEDCTTFCRARNYKEMKMMDYIIEEIIWSIATHLGICVKVHAPSHEVYVMDVGKKRLVEKRRLYCNCRYHKLLSLAAKLQLSISFSFLSFLLRADDKIQPPCYLINYFCFCFKKLCFRILNSLEFVWIDHLPVM